MGRPSRLRRLLKWSAITLAALVVAVALPVAYVETQCVATREGVTGEAFRSALPPAARRDEVNSYLTYPEWAIVNAYADLAAVSRRTSESDFGYVAAVRHYWSSFCSLNRVASARGPISLEYKTLLQIIGMSFTGEMGVKGLYETTIGRLSAWTRGLRKTPEDEFALRLADDYARFLQQTPWYEYPFATKLAAFWRETPLTGGNVVRKVERRIGLTLEWGFKAVYARLMAVLAGAAPAQLRIQSVVRDLQAADVEADPRITVVRRIEGGATVIETDRYRVFTNILTGLAQRGRNLAEIAGNERIMVSVLAPLGVAIAPAGTRILVATPVETRQGWQRLALAVEVGGLAELIRSMERLGLVLEHVYDY